jgi:hypothetical protein
LRAGDEIRIEVMTTPPDTGALDYIDIMPSNGRYTLQ